MKIDKTATSSAKQERSNSGRNILRLGTLLLIVLTLVFSGCSSYDDAKRSLAQKNGYIPADQIKTERIDPGVYSPEKFTYYFENEKEGIITFIDYSQTFIYCSIPDVKDNELADAFKSKVTTLEKGQVKLVFDLSTAFENHLVAPIPRVDSKYNILYQSGVDIRVSQLNTKFCVNEKGVLFFSSNAYEITEIHIFYNNQVSDIYKTHFEAIYKD